MGGTIGDFRPMIEHHDAIGEIGIDEIETGGTKRRKNPIALTILRERELVQHTPDAGLCPDGGLLFQPPLRRKRCVVDHR